MSTCHPIILFLITTCNTITMENNDDKESTRSWNGWLRPNDEARAAREEKLQALHQQAQREAMEHLDSTIRSEPNKDPFIAFKQFIDRRIDDIISIPQVMAANLRVSQAYHEQHKEWDSKMYAKWTGRPGCEADDAREIARRRLNGIGPKEAEEAARILLQESMQRNEHIPREKVDRLYHDDASIESMRGTLEHEGPSLSSTASGFARNPPEPRWLSVDWFKQSVYSPIALEMDNKLGLYDTKWRHAFEDLLEASIDKPILSMERSGVRVSPQGKIQSTWRGPGLDWMLSLHCRGFLPTRVPYANVARTSASMKAMYDDFYGARGEYRALVRELQTPVCDVGYEKILPRGEVAGQLETRCLFLDERNARERSRLERNGDPVCSIPLRDYKAQYPLLEEQVARMRPARSKDEEDMWRRDYENQLRMLEAQNAARLRHAREEQDSMTHPESELDMYEHVDSQASGKCPADIGRAIAEAARQERQKVQAEEPSKCPDELGHEVGEAAKDAGLTELLSLLGLVPTSVGACTRNDFNGKVDGDEDLFDEEDEEDADEDDDEFAEDLPGELRSQARLTHEYQSELQRRTRSAIEAREKKEAELETERPRVLSSLTTTQTTRAADGTVTTRVVLKRRFADGSEESNESVQTRHEGQEPERGVQAKSSLVEAKEAEEKAKKNKGWFWS
jgi:hypothetical protein